MQEQVWQPEDLRPWRAPASGDSEGASEVAAASALENYHNPAYEDSVRRLTRKVRDLEGRTDKYKWTCKEWRREVKEAKLGRKRGPKTKCLS